MRRIWLAGLALAQCLAVKGQAGLNMPLQLKEAAQAPIVAVGRVIAIDKDETAWTPWPGRATAATAEIEVLRAYPPSALSGPMPGVRILVWFYTAGRGVNGPVLPHYQPGRVYVFPLKASENPGESRFRLLADEGDGIVIAARADPPGDGAPGRDGRAFVLREIASALCLGDPVEAFGAASYLASQAEDFTAELMPLLETRIADDQQNWAKVATNLLSVMTVPRWTVSELRSRELALPSWQPDQALSLTQAALRKLPVSAATDELIIRTLLADAPAHPGGSALRLLEYRDSPVLIKGLRDALRQDITGSSYISWTLVRDGQRAVLGEALARALRVADRPGGDLVDLSGATLLLLQHGSDAQLDELAGLVRKYRTLDHGHFSALFYRSTGMGNPREARILAVLIDDKSPMAGAEVRYCDIAVQYLERATKEPFGSGGKTLAERDAAVARAVLWLNAKGIPH